MSVSSNMPSSSEALLHVYSNVFQPLFLPPPSEFMQPILDSFVASQDELLEDSTLFTSTTRMRETGVLVDGVTRELKRQEGSNRPLEEVSLEELRKLRLRLRLQYQAGGRRDPNSLTKEQILQKSKERMDDFGADMNKQEQEALNRFKDGLRNAVSM